MDAYEKSFLEFASSKFGIILGISLVIAIIILYFVGKHWRNIYEFIKALIDKTNPLSVSSFNLIFSVIVSNVCFWPTWLVLCIMDNIDNTPEMPFTLVDVPGGGIAIYCAANGIAALSNFGKQMADKKE